MASISRERTEKAYEQGIEAIIVLIETIEKEHGNQLQELSKRLAELENQQAKNSKNSHQPPSTDGFVKQTKSLRKKSERKVGGQEGHNLGWQETADIVIKHEMVECKVCGNKLSEVEGEIVEKRQVYDLPVIKVQVTEHQIEKKQCPHCHLVSVSKFPKSIGYWVQYGENIKGLITYLTILRTNKKRRQKSYSSDKVQVLKQNTK